MRFFVENYSSKRKKIVLNLLRWAYDKQTILFEREHENMAIKPQYETYRYTGEICRLQSQSIVECRLPGSEIGSILAVNAKAVPTECTCVDGEVRYSGKLLLCVTYEDGNRKICRVERGAEFFHNAKNPSVTPACFAKAAFTAQNITHRREGSGLYISVIVDADLCVYGARQTEYLVGGDGLVTKKKTVTLTHTVCVSGETEGEDEFETQTVGDILLHGESAIVHAVRISAGQLDIEGELCLHMCILQADESVCSYERLLPFHMQIPCEETIGALSASARVCVKSASLTAAVDEEKNITKTILSYCLSADCFLHTGEELSVVDDVFAPAAHLTCTQENGGGMYVTKVLTCTQRLGGTAYLSGGFDDGYALQAAVLPRAEIACKKTGNAWEAEGAIYAEVLLKNSESGYKSSSLSLPFAFPLNADGEYVTADCIVCGLNVRKIGENIEAEATVKVALVCYAQREWGYVLDVKEGEKRKVSTAAMSVFLPCVGEDLWQVAKRLACAPEELQKSNPELTFPVKEGERIYVYRQIP